jgi:cytochrome b
MHDGSNAGGRASALHHNADAKLILGRIHGALATITLALVVIHILGVFLACLAHREDLITPMFTGKKRPENE